MRLLGMHDGPVLLQFGEKIYCCVVWRRVFFRMNRLGTAAPV